MSLSAYSISYKSAPVELRERLAVPPERLADVLADLRQRCGLSEVVVLSTCNRVDFFFVARSEAEAFDRLAEWVQERSGAGEGPPEDYAVRFTGRAAQNHLFRVACSLESMVIGEPQILGQLKDAYELAGSHDATGATLNAVMPRAFRTAKRVRTETRIARFAVSVSYAAVELATRIFDTLEDKAVLVIGAGEMAELALSHLVKGGINRLLIANRTFSSAVELAERFQGSVVRYEELEHHLADADIVISSTGAKDYIIGPALARKASGRRRGRPMFFIDIAVPRDIDPAVNELPDVYCYDIDDLKEVVDANRKEREHEALKAQQIIEEETAQLERWFASLSVVPVIKSLREHFTVIGERELAGLTAQLGDLGPREVDLVRRAVRSLVNKLLHAPSTRLKVLADEEDGRLYAEALTALFDLGPAGAEAEPGTTEAPAADNVVPLSLPGTPRR